MSLKWFVRESRVYMAHLSDGEFYAKLPLAVMLYIVETIKDKVAVIKWRVSNYVQNKIRPH